MKRTTAEKPKRVRKLGQFDFKIWTPDGPRMQIRSTKNLTPDVWRAEIIENLEHLLRLAKLTIEPPRQT